MHGGGWASVKLFGRESGAGRSLLHGGRLHPIRPGTLDSSRRHSSVDGIGPLEHVSAALLIAGWSDWMCEVSGDGLPLLDGDAESFGVPRRAPLPFEAFPGVELRLGNPRGGWLTARSADRFHVHSRFGDESWEAGEGQLDRCGAARTFIGIDDLAAALAQGLLGGCTPEQGRVLGPARSKEGVDLALRRGWDPGARILHGGERFDGEAAAHKVLDLIGDLGLCLGTLPRLEIRMDGVGHREFQELGRCLAGTLAADAGFGARFQSHV